MGLFDPIGAGVLHSISENLNRSHKESLAREQEEINGAKSLYENLIKMEDTTARSIGLSGLASLADPKDRKKSIDTARRFISSAASGTKFEDAKKVVTAVNLRKKEKEKEAAPAPEPASYSVNPPPEIESYRDASGAPISMDEETAPSSPIGDAAVTGAPEPPPAPPIELTAALPATPQPGEGMNLTPSAGIAPPPAAPEGFPSRSEWGAANPLRTSAEFEADRSSDTRRDIATDNNATRMDIAEKRIAANIAAKTGQNSPYILTGVEAHLANVPDGTAVNPKIFTTLMREQGASLRSAAQASLTRELEAGRNSRTGSFSPEYDEFGRILGYNNPKTGATREPGFEGARRPRPDAANTRIAMLQNMNEDIDNLEELANANKGSIGRVEGNLAAGKRWLDLASPDVNDMFRTSDNLKDMLLRARSGAQINESEYKRLSGLVPDPRSGETQFYSNLKLYKSELRRLLERSTGGSTGGSAPKKPSAAPPDAPSTMRKIGDTKKFTSGPSAGKTGTWNGSGWDVEE